MRSALAAAVSLALGSVSLAVAAQSPGTPAGTSAERADGAPRSLTGESSAALRLDVAEIRPVIVESLRAPVEADESIAPIGVRDAEALEIEQARDLGEVLREMPGVSVSGGPRATAIQPVIRGLGGERVVIRLDGARQNFASGHRGRVFLDPFLLDRVEVLRGPASALYGSGALGGVVSFRTVDAQGLLGDDTLGGRVTAGTSSQGRERFVALSGAARADDDRYSVLGSVLKRESSDVKSGDGERIPFTGDDIVSGLVKLDSRLGDHRLTFGVQGFRDDHRLPSSANTSALTNIVDRRTDTRTTTARWRFDPASPFVNVDATLYYNDVDLRETCVENCGAALGRVDDTALTTLGFDAVNVSDFDGPVPGRLIVGVEALRDAQSGRRNGAPRPQFPDATRQTTAVYAQHTLFLGDHFELAPGLRYDRTRLSADGQPSRTDSETSASLGARFALTGSLALVAQYAEAFRSPALTDLYVGGLHFPGNFFVPNPDLRPETAKNREIGVVFDRDDVLVAGDRLDVRFNVFQTDFEDFIEQVVVFDPPMVPPMGPPTGRTFSDNVRDARIRGQELDVAYQAAGGFVRLAATRLRGTDRTTGGALGGIPADEVSLSGGRYLFNRDWLIGARVAAVASQTRVRDGETPTPGYTVWDAFVAWQPAAFDRRLRVDLRVDNLTDRNYRPHNAALPDAGRNVSLRASYRF